MKCSQKVFLFLIIAIFCFSPHAKPQYKAQPPKQISHLQKQVSCTCFPDSILAASDSIQILLNSYSDKQLDSLLLCMVLTPCSLSIKTILKAGANPNVTDSSGVSALLRAISIGNGSAVSALLNANASLTLTDSKGISPLFLALLQRNVPIASLLFSYGAQANSTDPSGAPLLFWPIRNRDSTITELLLRYGSSPSQTDNTGTTPLMVACSTGDPALIKLLLSYGALTDITDSKGRHSLFYAVERRDTTAISLLLQAGCSVTKEDYEGITPLRIAMQMGNAPIVSQLIARGADGYTPLLAACRDNNVRAVDSCLSQGLIQLEHKNIYGSTALIVATSIGSYAIVNKLILFGANVNAQNKILGSALSYAVSARYIDLVKLLIANGANPDLSGPNGESARSIARKNNDVSILEILDNR